jgi:hypothetical protein
MMIFMVFLREKKTKTREDRRMVNIERKNQHYFYGHILKELSTFIFGCMVIPLGPQSIRLHLVRGPKTL